MLHMKLKGIEYHENKDFVLIPLEWGQQVIFFTSESGHFAYQIK